MFHFFFFLLFTNLLLFFFFFFFNDTATTEIYTLSLHDALPIFETRSTDGVVRGAAEPLPPAFFLRATALTAPDPAISELARRAKGASELDRLYALMNAVRDRLDYRPGVTDAAPTAAAAL